MVIDFHTHCFPEKIAAKAMAQLSACSGELEAFHAGSELDLLRAVRSMGAQYAVVLNIATNPRQQKSVNDYAMAIDALEGLVAFGSVHPDSPYALDELERLARAGIKGIKLHPDYQHFFVDDERVFPLYEKAAELGLITVFHAGYDIGLPDPLHCSARALARALPAFNGGKVVAAHMGGYMQWLEALEHLAGLDIYFDTSYSYSRLPAPWAKRIIEKHSAARILFGSDMPWSPTDKEIGYIKCLALPAEDEAAILGGNAAKLLGIA